jgi:hypothetical protein
MLRRLREQTGRNEPARKAARSRQVAQRTVQTARMSAVRTAPLKNKNDKWTVELAYQPAQRKCGREMRMETGIEPMRLSNVRCGNTAQLAAQLAAQLRRGSLPALWGGRLGNLQLHL